MAYPKIDPKVRFMRKVRFNEETGCWDWTGGTSRGYAMFGLAAQKTVRAARWIYKQEVGPIPEGWHVDHLCRRPICVNPTHLEATTAQTNALRGQTLAAKNAAKTHCPQGHEYSGHRNKQGGRVCRICERARCRRYYHEHKLLR